MPKLTPKGKSKEAEKRSAKSKPEKATKQAKTVKKKPTKAVMSEAPREEEVKKAVKPFSDGLVSPALQGSWVTIPKSNDPEVDLLKSFLKYFGSTKPFIGSISSKGSFMKRKGGRLL